MTIPDHKSFSKGKFKQADSGLQEFIKECVAHFHYRDGFKNKDGSLGTVTISPEELSDLLTYAISIYR